MRRSPRVPHRSGGIRQVTRSRPLRQTRRGGHESRLRTAQHPCPAALVAHHQIDESREQVRAHERQVFGHRVGQTHMLAAHIIGLEPQLVIPLRIRERVGQHLGEPVGGQQVRDSPARLLRHGQTIAGPRCRLDGRDAVVAAGAGDFLDEVDVVGDVRAPAGHGHRQRSHRRLDLDTLAPMPSSSGHLGGGVVDTDQRVDALDREVDDGRLGSLADLVVAGLSVPPPSSTSRSAQRRAATGPSFGSTPRSKRREASDDSLWRREVRAMEIGSK
jgi:hypothetical protein